ncbi:DUF4397 domain-containing protein [Microbulbifer spongiae]|uniref:DUF4397 domain-containing protein n=1 Tax=Microbulbifer spongiae TaxID=2944933 RepID=A0ABY9EF26_9GAMM|nr:DUF4397 domain-containing protein [Microbulbifer sp. MI-G]WKD51540.1 DUF4397 domain-containing protein [Microbulbifer sp. MI-G]
MRASIHSTRIITLLFVPIMLLIISGCSNDDDDSLTLLPPPTPDNATALIRVTHASPDAPPVNLYVDGELFQGDVDYSTSTGLTEVPAGDLQVEVRGILPDGTELSVIGPVTLTLEDDTLTDVIAYDKLLDGNEINIKSKVIGSEISDIGSGNIRLNLLHIAPKVGNVDIYIGAPGQPLGQITPIDIGFGDNSAPLLVAAGEYQVRITPNGDSTVVYDSGTLSLAEGTDLLVAAIENTTGIGANPVNLLAIDAEGAGILYDTGVGAEVRMVHNSLDTPKVDVLVNGIEVIDALSYPENSTYNSLAAPAGNYDITVAADSDNTVAPIQLEELSLQQGTSYTAVAIGSLVDETLEALLTVDDRRTVATEARLRVIHGSYEIAKNIPVDIYLTESIDLGNSEPVIEDLAYGTATSQLPIPEGVYVVTVTAANDDTVIAFQTGPLDLNAGKNYTVIARDPSASETGAPLIAVTLLGE